MSLINLPSLDVHLTFSEPRPELPLLESLYGCDIGFIQGALDIQ